MRKLLILLTVISVLLIIVSCAPHTNIMVKIPETSGHIAGFWLGLWHGLILPFTFLISLFCDHVNIYEIHNSGGWYNFGYFLGASFCVGGSSMQTTKERN
jgi:hypothetical protein